MVSTLPFASRYQLLKIFCLKHWVFQIGSTGPWNYISIFSNWTKKQHTWSNGLKTLYTCYMFIPLRYINFPWCSRCLEVRLHRKSNESERKSWLDGSKAVPFFRMGDVCSTFERICIYIKIYTSYVSFKDTSSVYRAHIDDIRGFHNKKKQTLDMSINSLQFWASLPLIIAACHQLSPTIYRSRSHL